MPALPWRDWGFLRAVMNLLFFHFIWLRRLHVLERSTERVRVWYPAGQRKEFPEPPLPGPAEVPHLVEAVAGCYGAKPDGKDVQRHMPEAPALPAWIVCPCEGFPQPMCVVFPHIHFPPPVGSIMDLLYIITGANAVALERLRRPIAQDRAFR